MSVETFNLAAPPKFRGLDPHKPIRTYHRHLPHWRQDGATYFVTFRLADALPQEKLNYLQRLREHWEQKHPGSRTKDDWETLIRELFRCEDAWLDEGFGACHFKCPQLAAELRAALLHFQNERYHVSSWAVMPNHCHLTIRPFAEHELEKILQGMKSASAKSVNAILGTTGSLWQQESYDRIIRDEEHLWRVIQYIGRNPAKANLTNDSWRRWIDPAWQPLGWQFQDE